MRSVPEKNREILPTNWQAYWIYTPLTTGDSWSAGAGGSGMEMFEVIGGPGSSKITSRIILR